MVEQSNERTVKKIKDALAHADAAFERLAARLATMPAAEPAEPLDNVVPPHLVHSVLVMAGLATPSSEGQ